jgi:hypothetical protein
MLLLKLIFRLWFIGVQLGLWGSRTDLGLQHPHHHNTAAASAPTVGKAARQGRRFSMEDRAVHESSILGPGRGCGPANFTYAAGVWVGCAQCSAGCTNIVLCPQHSVWYWEGCCK